MSIQDSVVTTDADGTEAVTPELVHELDSIFSDMPTVDTVALAILLCKLTGRAKTE